MEGLPLGICFKILCLLNYQTLATAHQGKSLHASNLFKTRWGGNRDELLASPEGSKSWKDVYEVQDRCDRIGQGLKITREGNDYYLVRQGDIQHHLGSRKDQTLSLKRERTNEAQEEEPCRGVLDNRLFFIGDLEVASSDAERNKIR